jgi:hypothetical protein
MTGRDFEERTSVVLCDRNRTRPIEAVTIPEFDEMDFLVGQAVLTRSLSVKATAQSAERTRWSVSHGCVETTIIWRPNTGNLSHSSASLRSDHDAVVHVITMEWTD